MITSDELIKINDWLINKGFRIRVNLTGSNWNYDIYKLDENYRKYKKYLRLVNHIVISGKHLSME